MNEHAFALPLGNVRVSDTLLSTRRQSFRLADIDHVEVGRPLFLATTPVLAGCVVVAMRFSDLLTWPEIAWLVGIPAVLLVATSQIGVLRLHSMSVRNECVWGRYSDLMRARQQIETIMQARADTSTKPKLDVTE